MRPYRSLLSPGRVTNSSGSSSSSPPGQGKRPIVASRVSTFWRVGNTPLWRHPTRASLLNRCQGSIQPQQPFARRRRTWSVAQLETLPNIAVGFCCKLQRGGRGPLATLLELCLRHRGIRPGVAEALRLPLKIRVTSLPRAEWDSADAPLQATREPFPFYSPAWLGVSHSNTLEPWTRKHLNKMHCIFLTHQMKSLG